MGARTARLIASPSAETGISSSPTRAYPSAVRARSLTADDVSAEGLGGTPGDGGGRRACLRRSVYPPKTGRPRHRFAEPGNGCRGPALPDSAFRLPPASPAGAATCGGAGRPPGRGGCRRARLLRGTGRRSRSGPRTRSLRSASAWRCFLWRITDNCAIKLPKWRVFGIIAPYKQPASRIAPLQNGAESRPPVREWVAARSAGPGTRDSAPRNRQATAPAVAARPSSCILAGAAPGGGDADQPAERRRGSPAPPRRNQPARDQS